MPASAITGFVAYPSAPEQIGDSIRTGCKRLLTQKANHVLTPWESSDIAGYCLTDPILESIKVSDLLVADVTRLNFNVTYEIGYAIEGAGFAQFGRMRRGRKEPINRYNENNARDVENQDPKTNDPERKKPGVFHGDSGEEA
jgi:hypothetical protein